MRTGMRSQLQNRSPGATRVRSTSCSGLQSMWRLGRSSLVALLLVCLLLAPGCAVSRSVSNESPSTLRVSRIEIVDPKNPDGPAMLILGYEDEERGLFLRRSDGGLGAKLFVGVDGRPRMKLVDEAYSNIVDIDPQAISLSGLLSPWIVLSVADNKEASITIRTSQGAVTHRLCLQPNGFALCEIRDSEGRIVLRVP